MCQQTQEAFLDTLYTSIEAGLDAHLCTCHTAGCAIAAALMRLLNQLAAQAVEQYHATAMETLHEEADNCAYVFRTDCR